jgi:hypothetical protein
MSATLNMSYFRRIHINALYNPSWRTLRIPNVGLTMNNSFSARLLSTAEAMPKIAQASTWHSIIPKFLRGGGSNTSPKAKSKEWNPATFYVVIWTLIGSQAIQMLVLRKDFENYTRKADAKIRLLREVIQKVNNGETVDVERLLGTGDEVKEREWEEGQYQHHLGDDGISTILTRSLLTFPSSPRNRRRRLRMAPEVS